MSRRTPANLSQIARHLGLSVTTVSRALKDGPEVHHETRAKVQAAAAELGYVPNVAGRALRTGRTGTLTAILPLETQGSLSDLAKLPLIEGMTIAARKAGYALSVVSTSPEEDPQAALLRVLNAGSTDGVIITRMVTADPRPALLKARGFPFVTFGRSEGELTYSCIDIRNEEIAYDATARLAASGCRRIALQLLVLDDHTSNMRLQGYQGALAAAGLAFAPEIVGHSDYTIAASEAWVARLLALPDPPDGIVCANELGLMGALAGLRRAGLRAGRDLRVSVRDSTGLSRHVLASVGVHFVDLTLAGTLLVQALVTAVEQPEAPPIQRLLDGAFEDITLPA